MINHWIDKPTRAPERLSSSLRSFDAVLVLGPRKARLSGEMRGSLSLSAKVWESNQSEYDSVLQNMALNMVNWSGIRIIRFLSLWPDMVSTGTLAGKSPGLFDRIFPDTVEGSMLGKIGCLQRT